MKGVRSLEHLAAIAHGRTGGGFPEKHDIEPGDALYDTIMRIKREAYGRGRTEAQMYEAAAYVGDREFLLYNARESKRRPQEILHAGTKGGHEDVCRLAVEWGATDFDDMLTSAAKGGHEHLCRLAKEWGATDFDEMLFSAAEAEHVDLCRLAIEWGAEEYFEVFYYAPPRLHAELDLLWE
jgi:hypothetical protein